MVYAALEKIRSSILVRLGLLFADKAKSPLFDTVLRGTIVQPGTNQAQALRDLDTIREFLTGTGLIAFCDAPWVPVFVVGVPSCIPGSVRGRRGGIANVALAWPTSY